MRNAVSLTKTPTPAFADTWGLELKETPVGVRWKTRRGRSGSHVSCGLAETRDPAAHIALPGPATGESAFGRLAH